MAQETYMQGQHPNSLANLTHHKGRKSNYGTRKSKRGVSLTDEGWDGIKSLATEYGCNSVSDFLEKVGRGLVEIKASA
jgi:hypothetical protein